MDKPAPMISVVVATHNRAGRVAECLNSLLAQDRDDFEVIVVDDGSTDETPEVLLSHALRHPGKIRHFSSPNRGPGPARNAAVLEAAGEWIVIADDDTVMPPDWLSRLLAAKDELRADVVAYALEPARLQHPAERYLHYRNLLVTGTRPRGDYIGPAFFLISRQHYQEAGGFPSERMAAAEDYSFCQRLRAMGLSVAFDPAITVTHHFSTDWEGVRRRVTAAAVDGAVFYHSIGRSKTRIAVWALLKWAASPLWALWAFPPDLYFKAIALEWFFFRERFSRLMREM